jgi:hypothetical protein
MSMTIISQHKADLGLKLVRQPYSGHRPHKWQPFSPYVTKTVWPRISFIQVTGSTSDSLSTVSHTA